MNKPYVYLLVHNNTPIPIFRPSKHYLVKCYVIRICDIYLFFKHVSCFLSTGLTDIIFFKVNIYFLPIHLQYLMNKCFNVGIFFVYMLGTVKFVS